MITRTLLILGLVGWGATSLRSEEPLALDTATAKTLLQPYKSSLKEALVHGMKSGPMAAMDVCRVKAPRLAAKAARPGVRMGRTSHRLRNPANAPAEWIKPLLASYRSAVTPPPAQTVQLANGGTGYVEPIYVQSLCLTCHGSELADPVRKHLAELYPADQATGFREGEFRGLFWLVQDAP